MFMCEKYTTFNSNRTYITNTWVNTPCGVIRKVPSMIKNRSFGSMYFLIKAIDDGEEKIQFENFSSICIVLNSRSLSPYNDFPSPSITNSFSNAFAISWTDFGDLPYLLRRISRSVFSMDSNFFGNGPMQFGSLWYLKIRTGDRKKNHDGYTKHFDEKLLNHYKMVVI